MISLLSELSGDLGQYLRQNGGIRHWIWKGVEDIPKVSIEVGGDTLLGDPFQYQIQFTRVETSVEVVDESIAFLNQRTGEPRKPIFGYENGRPVVRGKPSLPTLKRDDINFTQSILSREQGSSISFGLFKYGFFHRIAVYQSQLVMNVGASKRPQAWDQHRMQLTPTAGNLAAVLNKIWGIRDLSQKLRHYLTLFYEDFEDLIFENDSGLQQIYFRERHLHDNVPATRLSDGTFRWLCLLAILLNPEPPQLICLEEPEIGLHPDVIVELAKLLRECSERVQLIVTTHSDTLIDALSLTPEDVLVCEKKEGSTTLTRLNEVELKTWLEQYSLGQLWRRGDIGGNRW